MWVTGNEDFLINILTKEFDFDIASWYCKKILHQTVITNGSITVIPNAKNAL